MTEPESTSSAADHAYFQALEAAFIRLRGAPLLLSPADWQIAKMWRREGIPLELVVRVMERIFERQGEGDAKSGIKSLRYFKTAVTRSWRRVLELGAGQREASGEKPPDVSAVLERLAKALPTEESLRHDLPEGSTSGKNAVAQIVEDVSGRIPGLSGAVPEVEAALQRLDREMMDRLQEELGAEALATLVQSAEENLESLAGRLTPEHREQTLELLVRNRLRKRYKLPVLSLFSPDARAPGRG